MNLELLQEKILTAVDGAAPLVLSVSHQIHDRPELGNQEFFASSLLMSKLEELGFTVQRKFAEMETAFCARKGAGGGPVIAFLAEYDALPEIGHACGHNVIATSSLSAAIGLGSVIDQIPGEVWLIGTPAEETVGAKVSMAERGYFQGVDVAMMIHPHIGNFYATHSLALSAIQVSFYGKPSHAATAPWEGVNALDALLLTFNNINALRQQIQPDARLHGIITKGGDAPNVIPEYTQGRFYVRAKRRDYLNQLLEKFRDCARAAAMATGCRVEFAKFEEDYDDMVNNLTLAQRMRDYLVENLGAGPFELAPDHFGSIDMGNVSHVVPAIHVLIDIANGESFSPHTREFALAAKTSYADEATLRAGKGLALTGYDLLTKPEFLGQARQEFER